MERLPKRTSLAQETAAILKEWIESGILQEVIPGELVLKKRLAVGRDTLRLALKLLENEKWITPPVKGQQRRILTDHISTRPGVARDQLPITFLSPDKVVHRITLMELEETQLRLATQGRELRFISPDIFQLQHPDRHLERLVTSNPSAAWILWIVSEQIQRWFDKQGIPAFLMGSPFPDVNLPFIVNDWEPAAFHAGLQLIRQGHREVAILEYKERFPGLVAEERGLARALTTATPQGRMTTFFDEGNPASVARSIEALFELKEQPTAVILTRASQVLTCFSWFSAHGIRVPGDISLISLANDSCFDDFFPSVAHYRSNTKILSRAIADRVLELIENGQVGKKSLRIPLEYVHGATIGSPPEQKSE